MCNNSCNECCKKVFSTGVSIITVDGVDTLVIDFPQQTFTNCQRGCFVITQTIPTTATIATPVAISIGGVVTTVYPVVNCNGVQVTAPMVRARRRYPFKVATNATSGVFKVLKNLSCAPDTSLATIPTVAPAEGG